MFNNTTLQEEYVYNALCNIVLKLRERNLRQRKGDISNTLVTEEKADNKLPQDI